MVLLAAFLATISHAMNGPEGRQACDPWKLVVLTERTSVVARAHEERQVYQCI